MKIWIKILFAVVLILAIFYSAVYVFMIFKGKTLIIKGIEDFTRRKVSVGYFDLNPPLNLEIRNLNINGLAKVERISISPSILCLILGNIGFNNISIVRPRISFERILPQTTELPVTEASAKTTTASETKVDSEKKLHLRLIFRRFTIKDGRIDFIDHTVRAEGIKITVKDINFNLTNLYTFPFSAIANFELKGRIPWQEGKEEGKINAEGWLNFYKKDVQAVFKIEDIDGIYLSPYYSKWIDLEKARIEKANLNFTSNIHGLNNNVIAECHLELTDIIRKPRPAEVPEEKAEKVTNVVLDTLKALDQGKIVLDFTIRTKMDKPEFGIGNIKMALEDKLTKVRGRSSNGFKTQDILMLPAKILEGTVKGATDISKAVIDGTFAVGKELKNAVEDTFKKEPK